MRSYLQAVQAGQLPIQDIYHLSIEAAMAKMIAVSFYFGEIDLEHFRDRFGITLQEHFAQQVHFALGNALLEYAGPCLRLTQKGVKNKNGVIALFYSGAVQDYLINLETSLTRAEFGRAQAA
jgi:oxygen-independent coproporphyrinogen-3 oxidase